MNKNSIVVNVNLKWSHLFSGFEMNHAGGMEVLGGNGVGGLGLAAPSDPVELRRLNFQTPGDLFTLVFVFLFFHLQIYFDLIFVGSLKDMIFNFLRHLFLIFDFRRLLFPRRPKALCLACLMVNLALIYIHIHVSISSTFYLCLFI